MGGPDLRPHIEKFKRRFAEVEAALNDPKVFENNQRAQELSREYARLKDLVAHGENYLKTLKDLEENRQLLQGNDAEMAEMAKEEVTRLQAEEKKLEGELQRGIIPPDPSDSRNTIIEIRAGTGGTAGADIQVLRTYLNIHFFRFRKDRDSCGTRVNPPLGLGRRNTLHAMDARFVF